MAATILADDLNDHHAGLSARPQIVSAGDCAPWVGISSPRELTPVSSRPEFYTLDSLDIFYVNRA
jgi:hypothetical protein